MKHRVDVIMRKTLLLRATVDSQPETKHVMIGNGIFILAITLVVAPMNQPHAIFCRSLCETDHVKTHSIVHELYILANGAGGAIVDAPSLEAACDCSESADLREAISTLRLQLDLPCSCLGVSAS